MPPENEDKKLVCEVCGDDLDEEGECENCSEEYDDSEYEE